MPLNSFNEYRKLIEKVSRKSYTDLSFMQRILGSSKVPFKQSVSLGDSLGEIPIQGSLISSKSWALKLWKKTDIQSWTLCRLYPENPQSASEWWAAIKKTQQRWAMFMRRPYRARDNLSSKAFIRPPPWPSIQPPTKLNRARNSSLSLSLSLSLSQREWESLGRFPGPKSQAESGGHQQSLRKRGSNFFILNRAAQHDCVGGSASRVLRNTFVEESLMCVMRSVLWFASRCVHQCIHQSMVVH